MQKCLNENDTLMYLTHNRGKSVVACRFMKNLKSNTYNKLTANYSKSYHGYLSKLVDQSSTN